MHLPALIQDLAVILGVAAVVTFVFRRIRQPVVLGYVIAGIIVGPYTPAFFSVSDTENIKVWAELGVIFLMFSLGLEFSFRRLARVGMSAGVTAVIQMVVMLALGSMAAGWLGWSRMDAVFLGCMIAISSTTIIIKALEELHLNTRRFAELVFGILIVEDLAAILMLVALTNIATKSDIGGVELLTAGGKLAIVVGAWFVVGMFLVPRAVKAVGRHGNAEMLTIVATALCLALVALAAKLHYSVALGAFIMGSILAESSEGKRIEHLVQPLRDVFGAIFFVSVGMLLDPHTLVTSWKPIALVSAIVIAGKLLSVTCGAFLTGQTVRTSLQTGLSMAQIGEFSFIIAGLGMVYNAINESVYPVIVAASVITTFTTPYLIKASGPAADLVERVLPARLRVALDKFSMRIRQLSVGGARHRHFYGSMTKWGLNAVIIITIFTLAAKYVIPLAREYTGSSQAATAITWILAFLLCAPSLLAMLMAFRVSGNDRSAVKAITGDVTWIGSCMVTIALVGLLSMEYFPALVTVVATFAACGVFLFVFRQRITNYYRWMENQFQAGFQANLPGHGHQDARAQYAPWDAHLVEVRIPARSELVGKNLGTLSLRERYGLNVVVITRADQDIVAPGAAEILYPGDRLLCFATDQEIETFRQNLQEQEKPVAAGAGQGFALQRLLVQPGAELCQTSIRDSGIQGRFGAIVVGVERGGVRMPSPKSDTILQTGDILWVVGSTPALQSLANICVGKPE